MRRVVLTLAAALLLVVAAAGCQQKSGDGVASAAVASPATDAAVERGSGPPVVMPEVPGDDYAGLARQLQQAHVHVWFEADLVAAWLAGPASFDTAVSRLGMLADLPGVDGVKIADELGYNDGLRTEDEVVRFLDDSRRALDSRTHHHTKILVDVLVPELGCLAWTDHGSASCATSARDGYPAATEAALTTYLHGGALDAVDLSTGLLDPSTYTSWGLSREQAQDEAWTRVRSLGWEQLASLRARKALAAPGGYQGGSQEAEDDVRTFVDTPVRDGAEAVDIWTWRQPYDGDVVSLLAPDLTPNPLWIALLRARAHGAVLFTHMTPSQMPTDEHARDAEVRRAAQVFDAVFVAAGTG